MKKKYILTMALFSLSAFLTYAQNEIDVYRYSNIQPEGSARFDAMAGSFGALGIEGASGSINPAGYGRASQSILSASFNGFQTKTLSHFKGEETAFQNFNVRMPNLSATFVKDVSAKGKGLLYTQYSFGLNRIANFNQSFNYKGQQFESLLDVFANTVTGIDPNELYNYAAYTSSLAYQTYAIDPDVNNNYYPRLNAGDMLHNRVVLNSGGINEWYFAFSGNYIDKIYFGASFSYNTLNFAESIVHKETLTDTTLVSLRSFNYQYRYKTKGAGMNVKLGAIYLPNDYIRLGLAIHTPTFYNLTDEYTANMQAVHYDGVYSVDPSFVPNDKFKYRIWTPTRVVGSTAFIIREYGCINLDFEYVNYKWGQLKQSKEQAYATYTYANENAAVKATLVDALNIRIGTEWNIREVFYLRAGYGFYPKGSRTDRAYGPKYSQLISGGFGFRINRVFIDLACKYYSTSSVYYAFQESSANIQTSRLSFNLGVRYKLDYR